MKLDYFNALILNNSHFIRNKIVLNLESKFGLLAIFAAQAGAKKVYIVEEKTENIYWLQRVINFNNFHENIKVLKKDSEELKNLKADVILSDWAGSVGVNSNIIENLIHYRDSNLIEGGVVS